MAPPNYESILAQWRYPGLMEAENAVAKRWVREKGAAYDSIDFNVPIGPQPAIESDLTDDERSWANFLYATKIDILAKQEGRATIIEVKRRLTKSAMGKLAHYAYWYQKQHPDEPPPIVRAIAEWADPGIAESTLANGIDVELYGEPTTA